MYIKKLSINKSTKYTLFSIYMIFKDVCYHELYKLLVSSMKNVKMYFVKIKISH